jgi:hypothetical protein
MKELIMCYGIRTDTEKDVSKLSSRKEESAFTPREGIDERSSGSLMSGSGVAGMLHKLFTPSVKDKGGSWKADDTEMKSTTTVEKEVEKID